MTSRLSTVAADLAARMEVQDPVRLRTAAEQAVKVAVAGTGLAAPEIDDALAALRAGRFGDSPVRVAVLRLVDELDEVAWDLQEQFEIGTTSSAAYLSAFGRARAAAAVGFALDSDALTAALEAVYEAQAAVSGMDIVRVTVESVLAE